MTDTEPSSSSSSSSQSSPSSSPEVAKKVPKSPMSSREMSNVSNTSTSPPEVPKKRSSSSTDPPEVPKKRSSSSADPPEVPKKGSSSSISSSEVPRERSNSSTDPPEVPKKASNSSTSPEVPKKESTSSTSREMPKKTDSSSTSPPKVPKKIFISSTSPEVPKKVSITSPKISEKVKMFSSFPPAASKTPKTPPSSPEASKKIQKLTQSSPESPEEEHKPTTEVPKDSPKKFQGRKSFKSSLQVFLQQKHGTELQKTIDYKDKLERGEIDEDEEADEERRAGRRGSSEDGKIEKEQHGNNEDSDAVKTRESKDKAEEGSKKQTESKKETLPENLKESSEEGSIQERKKGEENKVIEEAKASEKKAKETKGEKSKAGKEREIKAEKKEKEKQPEKKTEKAKGKKKDHNTNNKEMESEEKMEEKPKEVTKKEDEEIMKEEASEPITRKEEEEGTSMRRKKRGMKDVRAQGYLYLKKKRTFTRWKEYYFVVDGLLLTYYRSHQDYERRSSIKGSLDLAKVEEVHAKKPGLMRTHHPFCLARRNLPSINLAADKKEEEERWIEVLKTAVGPQRLSCYSSDKNLNSGISPAKCSKKFSTLPTCFKDVNPYSSSITEEEDDEETKEEEEKKEEEKKKEEKKKEEEEEEEPKLIKPKKVTRVPIGMPLVPVNLGQVKLKKVEKEVEKEDVEEGKAADVSSSSTSPHEGHRESHKQEDHSKETSPLELFGVVLKKTKNEDKEEEEKEEESSKETGGGREGSASPGYATSSNRRPLKQPVIPLNTRKLLIVPEVKESKSSKVSPVTQKRSTVDRRKSPSPSLPISRSVQALTKSAEEVRPTQVDTVSSADTTNNVEGKGKEVDVKVCHAHTNEVKYTDVVDILDVEKVTEGVIMVDAEEQVCNEEEREKKKTLEDEEKAMKDDEHEQEDVKKVPLDMPLKLDESEEEDNGENMDVVPAALKEETLNDNTFGKDPVNNDSHQVEASIEEHKLDGVSSLEDKIGGSEAPQTDTIPDSSSVATPLTPPTSPASSEVSTDLETVPKVLSLTSSSESIPLSSTSGPPSPKETPPSPGERRDLEENIHVTIQEDKLKTDEKQEQEVEVEISDSPRDRASTNESTASSCLEGGEKKPGKFKLLKNMLKGGSVKDKKEESGIQKEPKEKKRRGSNAFTVLLQGKKFKEANKKPTEEELQTSQVDASGSPTLPHQKVAPSSESPPTPTKEIPVPVVPVVDVQVTPPPVSQPSEEEVQDQQEAFPCTGNADDGMVNLRTQAKYCETRDSIYSHTSIGSRDDPPPSIPEKTYKRAASPNHDVPKNNRPVTDLHSLVAEEEYDDEDETSQRVDGYITEEQIEALLNAKENRDKRKRSLSRSQGFAQPDVVKDTPAASLSNEEWATKRPSYTSFCSIDSDRDEPLPTTNFLSLERQLSSSSSIKGLGEHSSSSVSESGDSLSPEVECFAEPVRRAPRPTDGITAKNRVSLTSPEFTVMEEDALSSPETPKARPAQDNNEDENADNEQFDSDEDEPETKAEYKDFFPVVGGDVQMRPPVSMDLPTANLRTSGIVGLKQYLEAQGENEDLQDVKSGISRLGHSAAVEKLKQTTSEQ